MVELSLTPGDVEKLRKVGFNDIPEIHEFEGNNIFRTIGKSAIPLINNTLPKVLGTLGLTAATGATHKTTSGRDSKQTGDSVRK